MDFGRVCNLLLISGPSRHYISRITSHTFHLTHYLSHVTSHALYLTLPLQVYNNVKMFLAAGGVEVLCYVAVSDSSLTG